MGSTTSLDVDRIQKKNDARLRRLHQMNSKSWLFLSSQMLGVNSYKGIPNLS